MFYGIAYDATQEMVDLYNEMKGKRLGRFGILSNLDRCIDSRGKPGYVFRMKGNWFSYVFAKIKLRNDGLVFRYR